MFVEWLFAKQGTHFMAGHVINRKMGYHLDIGRTEAADT
jgi:hypothetical protein